MISTQTTKVQYNGNGITTVFSYPFRILRDTDLLVIRRHIATSVETTLVLNADYTVTNAGVNTGGNVYNGSDLPALVRDSVSGVSMPSVLNAWNNTGFANDLAAWSTADGLKTNQAARLGKITSGAGASYMEVISKAIASGATEVFDVKNFLDVCC